MRWVFALVIVAACGRLGIDASEPVDASEPDAEARTCAADGDACDDGNICTAASRCSGGTCIADEPASMCRVADSTSDFATVQGSRGWYYGFWYESRDSDAVYSVADFTPFTIHAGELWRPADFDEDEMAPTFTWAYLAVWGGHPGQRPEKKLPIRRWISDVTGAADVAVHLAKSDTTGGDGTRAILFVDGVEVFRRDVTGTDGQGFIELVPVTLSVGTTVDLMLHYIADEAIDTSETWMQIRSR